VSELAVSEVRIKRSSSADTQSPLLPASLPPCLPACQLLSFSLCVSRGALALSIPDHYSSRPCCLVASVFTTEHSTQTARGKNTETTPQKLNTDELSDATLSRHLHGREQHRTVVNYRYVRSTV